MLSRRKVTWPSQNRWLAPAPWKLNGSSLGPQLLADQGQKLVPPNGEELLLMNFRVVSPQTVLSATLVATKAYVVYDGSPGELLSLADWGGPETPLAVSGSAQRHALRANRVPLPLVATTWIRLVWIGSTYLGVLKVSLRPTSSMRQMVLLVPSEMSPTDGPRGSMITRP